MELKVKAGVLPFQPPPEFVLAQQLLLYMLWGPTFCGIYGWANEAVKKGRVLSRVKVYLAISILCLVTVVWAVGWAYSLHLTTGLTTVRFLFLTVFSCLDFFPIYTLLKRKVIPYKIFVLTGLLILIPVAVFWSMGF